MHLTQLGYERGANAYNVVNVLRFTNGSAYLDIFNEQWNNVEKFEDVTKRIVGVHRHCISGKRQEYIYFIALYNIFNEFLEDISEDVLPNERTGFLRLVSFGISSTTFNVMLRWLSSTSWKNTMVAFLLIL